MALNISQYTARLNGYGYESKSGIIEDEKQYIKDRFFDNPNYQLVEIEDVERNVHIISNTTLSVNPEVNQMNSYPEETFNNGDYVTWGSTKWIILNDFGNKDIQDKVEISRCRLSLKWKDGLIVYEYPACHKILSESTHGELSRKIITTSDGKIKVYVQKNTDTSTIYLGQKFIINGVSYSVGLIENIEFENVLTVFLQYHEINKDTDDLINSVADNDRPSFHVDLGV